MKPSKCEEGVPASLVIKQQRPSSANSDIIADTSAGLAAMLLRPLPLPIGPHHNTVMLSAHDPCRCEH